MQALVRSKNQCFPDHRRIRANELLEVLVDRLDSESLESLEPLVVNEGARADIRLRSEVHDPVYIGDAGALWLVYKPQGVYGSLNHTCPSRSMPDVSYNGHGQHSSELCRERVQCEHHKRS